MTSLPDALTGPENKAAVIDDCLALIDAEVSDKGGLSGLAIKAGYAAVKGIKPGFVKQAVTDLMPEFATALQPIYDEAKTANKAVREYFASNSERVADALLAITDAKAARSKHKIVKGTYDKLRNIAKKNVEAAIPRLAKMIEKHAS